MIPFILKQHFEHLRLMSLQRSYCIILWYTKRVRHAVFCYHISVPRWQSPSAGNTRIQRYVTTRGACKVTADNFCVALHRTLLERARLKQWGKVLKVVMCKNFPAVFFFHIANFIICRIINYSCCILTQYLKNIRNGRVI